MSDLLLQAWLGMVWANEASAPVADGCMVPKRASVRLAACALLALLVLLTLPSILIKCEVTRIIARPLCSSDSHVR